jgi:hypothetical protein
MNNQRLPGFTAEASLYKMRRHFYTASGCALSDGAIHPAQGFRVWGMGRIAFPLPCPWGMLEECHLECKGTLISPCFSKEWQPWDPSNPRGGGSFVCVSEGPPVCDGIEFKVCECVPRGPLRPL